MIRDYQFLARLAFVYGGQNRYLALVQNDTPALNSGLIDNYIARSRRNRILFCCGDNEERGKRAITGYTLLKRYRKANLMLFKPYTGRTHQLRVHSQYLGFPIIGDSLYGKAGKLMLHAWKLKIILPGHNEPTIFMAPTPQRFYQFLKE
jgi:23S rRNA pseudouridine1911/1915/1917 synthase